MQLLHAGVTDWGATAPEGYERMSGAGSWQVWTWPARNFAEQSIKVPAGRPLSSRNLQAHPDFAEPPGIWI